eukprot:RCo030192
MPVIMRKFALGRQPWTCLDPFLFCVHHVDRYPAGTPEMGPDPSLLQGRSLGQDFSYQEGWSMYHGTKVPGFPAHPHCGFETVTVTRRGVIDHSDSLGATARYGEGDVQWLTTGRGVQHSEMFPLLDSENGNPMELFQIWLNLPRASKAAQPHFAMLWNPQIPTLHITARPLNPSGAISASTTTVAQQPEPEPETPSSAAFHSIRVIAGSTGYFPNPSSPQLFIDAPPPPPESWASHPDSDVAIWVIRVAAGCTLTLPKASSGSAANRCLYYYEGEAVVLIGDAREELRARHGAVVDPTADLPVTAPEAHAAHLLLLQGRPIGEPVEKHGPFVMNTVAEIEKAYTQYRKTRFGGWPFPTMDPVHPSERKRFAKHADGKVEHPTDA